MPKPTIFPTVHLNGTNGNVLLQEYVAAMDAIRQAANALANVTVHGRDYYTQAAGAYATAREEHHTRLKALEDMQSELEEIALKVQEQI